jgi:hypothetical protein
MPQFQIEKNATSVPEFTEVGMYPIYYITSDGILCPDCVNGNLDLCRDKDDHGWYVVASEVNWESLLYCDNCSNDIVSAYGVVDENIDTDQFDGIDEW